MEFGLRHAGNGRRRVAYSARHGYATELLNRDVFVDNTALLLGTSRSQIVTVYSHVVALNIFKKMQAQLLAERGTDERDLTRTVEAVSPDDLLALVQAAQQDAAVVAHAAAIGPRAHVVQASLAGWPPDAADGDEPARVTVRRGVGKLRVLLDSNLFADSRTARLARALLLDIPPDSDDPDDRGAKAEP